MAKPEFTLKFVKEMIDLHRFGERLNHLPVFALDIETSEWWNRHQERIALIQFAYRSEGKIRVVIVDALADIDIELLRPPLENESIVKVVHNASFDVVRLAKHYDFKTAPVFDTMAAARRNGERKYSLQAQAETHLHLHLDKTLRNRDWSVRPLDIRQLHYAALDAYATLLLYENQTKRRLHSDYRLKPPVEINQNFLPLEESLMVAPDSQPAPVQLPPPTDETALPKEAVAVLGVIAELPNRYHPAGLAASVGNGRIGLAGWIIDQRLGKNAEPDEESIKLAIAALCEKNLIRITESQRMEATEAGMRVWKESKNN